jgi:hypothetical protein
MIGKEGHCFWLKYGSKELSFGRTFTQVLHERYCSFSEDEESSLVFVDSVTKKTKPVEMVGMKKIANIQKDTEKLKQVALVNQKIGIIDITNDALPSN